MSIRVTAAIAAAMLFTSAAVAQDSPAPEAKPVPEKKLCRSVVPTGTIMAKRICLTKKEWAEFSSRNDRHNDMFRDNKNKGLKPEEM